MGSSISMHTLSSGRSTRQSAVVLIAFWAGRPIVGTATNRWVEPMGRPGQEPVLWLPYTCLVIHLILTCISFLQSICWEPSMSVAGECMGLRTPAHRSHSEELADLARRTSRRSFSSPTEDSSQTTAPEVQTACQTTQPAITRFRISCFSRARSRST